eukprot:2974228-Pyramimonas_sp.AAC.1
MANSGKLVQSRAYCYVHERECCYERARIHIAGTPCPDWSPQQNDRDGMSGCTILPFYVWCAQRRLLQESGILRENVEGFPVALLVQNLGGHVV